MKEAEDLKNDNLIIDDDDISQLNINEEMKVDPEFARIEAEFKAQYDKDMEDKKRIQRINNQITLDSRKKKEAERKKRKGTGNVSLESTFANAKVKAEPSEKSQKKTQKKANKISKAERDELIAKKFITSEAVLSFGMDALCNELKEIREILRNTQADREKNFFFNNNGKGKIVEREGSDLYQDMTEKLRLCIDIMEIGTHSPEDIREALLDFQKSAAKYHKERNRMITGPWSKKGRIRRDAAKAATEIVPTIISCFDNMMGEFYMVKNKEGVPYSEQCLDDIKKKSMDLTVKHDQFQLKGDFNAGKLKNGLTPKKIYKNKFMRAKKQQKLINKIAKIYPSLAKNCMDADNLDKLFSNAKINHDDVTSVARFYVAAKLLKSIVNPKVKNSELDEIEENITRSFIYSEADKIKDNPSFVREFKANTSKLLSRWDNINKVNKSCLKLQKTNQSIIAKTIEANGSLGDAVVVKLGDKCEVFLNTFCRMMVSDLLAKPDGEVLVSKFDAIDDKDAMYQAMTIVIQDIVKDDSRLKPNASRDEVVEKVNNLIEDPLIRNKAIKSLLSIKDPKQITNAHQGERMEKFEKDAVKKEELLKTEEYRKKLESNAPKR